MIRRLSLVIGLWLCALVLTGCGGEALPRMVDDIVIKPQSTPMPTNGQGTTGAGETDWQQVKPGVEWRRMEAKANGGAQDLLIVARVDPSLVHVRVAYDVGAPGTIREWGQALNPLLVVNGGFFDQKGRATALVINDGSIHGSSYDGFGGMFTVGHDGSVSIRSLREQPYDSAENLAQALQSTPMLLLPDGSIPSIDDNGERARRSVVALDRQGRLVFIVSPRPAFTLDELAHWLRDSALDLKTALNLDGGSSTGIFLRTGRAEPMLFDSLTRVPLVISVTSAN